MRQARSGHWKSALTHRRPISGACVINRIAPPPHHLNVHIEQITPERRHGVLKDEKKRRSQNRIKILIALLWGVHSGGERESAGKKQGRKTNVRVFCCFGLIFFVRALITRHTGVVAAQTQRTALLIDALGPLRALEVGPGSAAVRFRNLRPQQNRPTTQPPEWPY